jgi:hypothetical protein
MKPGLIIDQPGLWRGAREVTADRANSSNGSRWGVRRSLRANRGTAMRRPTLPPGEHPDGPLKCARRSEIQSRTVVGGEAPLRSRGPSLGVSSCHASWNGMRRLGTNARHTSQMRRISASRMRTTLWATMAGFGYSRVHETPKSNSTVGALRALPYRAQAEVAAPVISPPACSSSCCGGRVSHSEHDDGPVPTLSRPAAQRSPPERGLGVDTCGRTGVASAGQGRHTGSGRGTILMRTAPCRPRRRPVRR